MTDHSVRCLPPLVEGNIYGILKVTVDEVLWCGAYPSDVVVLMQWWGEVDSISLRPSNVSKYPEQTKDNCSIVYNIHTNLQLFETYLKQCCKLKLIVINDQTKDIVGHVDINHLCELVTGIQYRKYFPVITSSGKRIGDLKVDFEFRMNSVPEEIKLNKIKKHSRKRNKNNQSSSRTASDEKAKQNKRGCKTCFENLKTVNRSTTTENKINLDAVKSPVGCKVPPYTQQSDISDCAFWDALDKGKKLRDAMVLSILEEDSSDSFSENLLLQPVTNSNKTIYEPLKTHKNGEVASFYEEKLINEYLEGKPMREEEEIFVLNALHGTDLKTSNNTNTDVCGHILKNNCLQSVSNIKIGSDSEPETLTTMKSHFSVDSEMNKILEKVNCFRLTVDSLTLTKAGWKKINRGGSNKNKSCKSIKSSYNEYQNSISKTPHMEADDDPPLGATYFVECHFVEESPRSVTQLWKTTPLRFCSRRQIENVVYFGQCCAHSLRPQAHIAAELAAASCVVCWRHLHQRVPSQLGSFSLTEGLFPSETSLQTSATVPVIDSNSNSTVAHLRLTLTLGRGKLHYGEDLLRELQEGKGNVRTFGENKKDQIDTAPLSVKDLSINNKIQTVDVKTSVLSQNKKTGFVDSKTNVDKRPQSRNYIIPECANCSQILVLSGDSSFNSSLCRSCIELLAPHRNICAEPIFTLNTPANSTSGDQRHHKFLIGLDSVIGFPLFAGIEEELSCYVDYKFPEVTSDLKAVMSKRDTTTRVVNCEPQVSLSSVHCHHLSLPVALPLSPLLAACSPGITLRLWLRYYQPSPRDHMVAMALLPMDELCLLELEFDKKQQKSTVIKVLELPLALVPSSVTTAYQQYRNLGVLRVSITYSNVVTCQQSQTDEELSKESSGTKQFKGLVSQEDPSIKIHSSLNVICSEPQQLSQDWKKDMVPIDILLDQITDPTCEELKTRKNKFWTGPFGKDKQTKNKMNIEKNTYSQNGVLFLDPVRDMPPHKGEHVVNQYSQAVMKEEFYALAENLEQRFNQLQSDMIKEKQCNSNVDDKFSVINNVNEDLLEFHSLSSTNSIESLPFILGPPADFKDPQNFISQSKRPHLGSPSLTNDLDTICGFLKEEQTVANLGSNETFERREQQFKPIETKTFKAKIKIDRAVNLKAIKGPFNGKKGKIPPSTWVSFGVGDCYKQNCDKSELACSGIRYNTPVVRRDYNPVWNLSWDVDLPVDYLQQINKCLVFRVFEENLDAAFGFASANVSILTSGLPCLSSWLSINDMAGACKGQIKIVITPLEDVSKYQEHSVFDIEEDEFEEFHKDNKNHNSASGFKHGDVASCIAGQNEVFVSQRENEASSANNKEVEQPMFASQSQLTADSSEFEDTFSADDVISDYKNTLENNFRNEMAGLENLIKFLRVGSMSNELSFLRSNENKENLSSNPSSQLPSPDSKMTTVPLINQIASVGNELSGQSELREKAVIDACTEFKDKSAPMTNQSNSEDIITKLLQQISMFQLPTVKTSDNTCQTVIPETKESFTETTGEAPENLFLSNVDRTIHVTDATTQTEDVRGNQPAQLNGELESALLNHLLICKPTKVRVCDSFTQTGYEENALPTTDSSGVFMSSCISSEILQDNLFTRDDLPKGAENWISPDIVQTNGERLVNIDNNIKDLERFLKENLILADRNDIPSLNSVDRSSFSPLNGDIDSTEASINQDSPNSSEEEYLVSYSKLLDISLENSEDVNIMSTLADANYTETTLRREGTFVIEKPSSCTEGTLMIKESGDNHTA